MITSIKQRQIKIEPRIKLNHNIYNYVTVIKGVAKHADVTRPVL